MVMSTTAMMSHEKDANARRFTYLIGTSEAAAPKHRIETATPNWPAKQGRGLRQRRELAWLQLQHAPFWVAAGEPPEAVGKP
jgi:hypothetical protein